MGETETSRSMVVDHCGAGAARPARAQLVVGICAVNQKVHAAVAFLEGVGMGSWQDHPT